MSDMGLPATFENPGLPPHVHRAADDDPRAAKRAERQVAALFTLSIIGTLGFIVSYFAVPNDTTVFIPFIGKTILLNILLGVTLAVSLLGIGFGAVHWAKTLMSDEEVIEERHPIASSDEDRAKAVGILNAGAEQAQLKRRPILKATGATAMGLFALPLGVQLAGSMGNPTKALEESKETIWDVPKGGKPIRLVRDVERTPIKASDVAIGSVFHILPETIKDSKHVLADKAKAAVLLMRLHPSAFANDSLGEKAKSWGYEGIVAYSKICTHVGCPVGLYEQQTHHLLCPCHQSTFDVTRDCNVIFGPAKRALPQLKITVDDEGYLVAPQGFVEPVGPSYWERKK
ncbi:MAG: Rieske (2Fe-2S) protein [Dermatophilaceae bacterium]|jgi:ubiquinol-cytochrome c reductase iron-sulfur subunit|nr:Rieske (2Fe-2S) protein [Dermatophilaceae bacterium]MBP9917861.1 Rieske (2Fe-2S) protein [Dermatophilaceae bacterium]